MADDARPAAVGPYTPVVRAGDFLICSGQLGLENGEPADGLEAQVRLAVGAIEGLLAQEGAKLTDVVKTTVLLADIGDFASMNEAYVAAFGDHRPARTAFAAAGLPRGAQVEVEAWAYAPSGRKSQEGR